MKRIGLIVRAGRAADSYRPDLDSIPIEPRWHHLLIKFMEKCWLSGYKAGRSDELKRLTPQLKEAREWLIRGSK